MIRGMDQTVSLIREMDQTVSLIREMDQTVSLIRRMDQAVALGCPNVAACESRRPGESFRRSGKRFRECDT